MRHVFISPHLDDAVLSAGDLIAGLLKDGEKVRIITVFTDFGAGPMHLNARRYVFESGALTVHSFKRLRLIEDRRAMEKLGVGGHVDHMIVNQAVKKLKADRKYFWLDLPYAVKPEFNGNLENIKRYYRLKFSSRITTIK